MRRHIALLDDNPDIRAVYAELLTEHEFDVTACSSRDDMNLLLEDHEVDAFVIDIILPGDSSAGLHYCQELRQRFPTKPIVILSALAKQHDKVAAYHMGADNYIVKGGGGDPDYLIVVLSAHLRRIEQIRDELLREFHQLDESRLQLDEDTLSVTWDNQAVDLNPQQFAMVACLYSNQGKVQSVDELMVAAGKHVEAYTVSVDVRHIRKLFRDVDPTFKAIQTIRNQGYRWREISWQEK